MLFLTMLTEHSLADIIYLYGDAWSLLAMFLKKYIIEESDSWNAKIKEEHVKLNVFPSSDKS